MLEGFVPDNSFFGPLAAVSWIAGKLQRGRLGGIKLQGKERHFIRAFRCNKCGYLELYAPAV